MSTPPEIPEIPEIFVRPLSEQELAQFTTELNSEAGQAFIRSYHKSAMLSAAQELVYTLATAHPVAITDLVMACIDIWLEKLEPMHEAFNKNFAQRWKSIPDILCRTLLQQAVEALNAHRSDLSDFTPEIEEMARDWVETLPLQQSQSPSTEGRQLCLSSFRNFDRQAEAIENLKMRAVDYLENWTHLLLQIYSLGVLRNADVYSLLASNWEYFLPRLPNILEALTLLEGYEHLLLPENKEQLTALLIAQQQKINNAANF